MGNNDPGVFYMIESSGMTLPNRVLDVTTVSSYVQISVRTEHIPLREWEMFPAPTLYAFDNGGPFDVMLCHGPWLDRRALEEASTICQFVCDRWLPRGYLALVGRLLVLAHVLRV